MLKKRKGRFEVFPSDDGWRWRLLAGNGEVVAQSEGYGRRHDAEEGARAAKAIAKKATLER